MMSDYYRDLKSRGLKLFATLGSIKSTIIGLEAILVPVFSYMADLAYTEIFVLTVIAVAGTLYILEDRRLHNLKFPRRDKHEDRTYNVLETYFSKKSIRVIDFIDAKTPPVIEDKIFEDCTVYGPVVLGLIESNTIKDSGFSGTLELMMIEVESGRVVQGVVGIKNCTFRRCKFENISFVGPREVLNYIGASMTNNSPAR